MREKKQFEDIIGDFDPNHAPPKIDPVPPGIHRPLWSVMIPTFNCAKYLEKTLESVLCQDPGPDKMQIEVIDDNSTKDDPESVVKKAGTNRVTFSRNPINTGLCSKNFNICLRKARGHLVHVLHGDDYVLPGFYELVEKAMQAHPNAGMAINRFFVVNDAGQTEKLVQREIQSEGPHFQFANHLYHNGFAPVGMVFRRQAIEHVGGFREDLKHCADWEIAARIYSKNGALYLNEPKACYRVFEGNDTSKLAKTGENIRESINTLTIFEAMGLQINRDQFLKLLIERAEMASLFFFRNGNQAAGKANKKISRQIEKLLSPNSRKKRLVKKIILFVISLLKKG